MAKILQYEIEIRDTNNHTSDSADGDAGATVVEDTLHPNALEEFTDARVFIEDDHDASFDVSVELTAIDDANWSGVNGVYTYNVASGADADTTTLPGPLGKVRLTFAAGALASAPTGGSCRVSIYLAN